MYTSDGANTLTAFQIKGIDLNQSAGDSWMGLTRQQARTLALVFIVVGIGLADIFTGIDDWLNWGVVWGLIRLFPATPSSPGGSSGWAAGSIPTTPTAY